MFGIPFPALKERMDRFECGARVVKALWRGEPVTLDEYRQRRTVLEGHGRAVKRDPASIRHSLMIPVVIGRTPAELDARLQRILGIFPRVPGDAAGWKIAGFLYGSPDEVSRDLAGWHRAGMSRVMLQMLDMTDVEAIDLITRHVLPALR